jgi:hypothetical protein
MEEQLHAILAVICVLIGCLTIGDLIVGRLLRRRAPADVALFSAGAFGLGLVAVTTAIVGAVSGFSARMIVPFWYALSAFSCLWWLIRPRAKRSDQSTPGTTSRLLAAGVFAALAYHVVAFLLVGLSYPLGSDSFTYLLIPQTFLRNGIYTVPRLEPLGEPMPFFNAPFAFELVYLHVLALSNLIGPVLIAKLIFPITCLLIYVLGRRLAGPDAGLFALAVLLVQPFLLYFFSESLDNYFIAVCFELLAYYYLWRYYDRGGRLDLLLAGSFLGFMFAVKETTIYYLIAILVLAPLLILAKARRDGMETLGGRPIRQLGSLLIPLFVPVLFISAVFPIILALKTGALPYGGAIVARRLGLPSPHGFYEPMVALGYSGGYSKFVRYASEYGSTSFPPESLTPLAILLSRYLNNPFQLSVTGSMTAYSVSPIALVVNLVVFPPLFFLIARRNTMLLWTATTLWLAYAAKLATYPFVDPPKSELFQIVPTALTLAVALRVRHWERLLRGLTVCLLLLAVMNGVRSYKRYSSTIRRYTRAPIEDVADSFRQKWYRDHLSSSDVLFGRLMNEYAYIDKGRCIPFFWRALYFVPWKTVEQRIDALGVTVLYDSTAPPAHLIPPDIAPFAERTDPALYKTTRQMEATYLANYEAKEKYLSQHFVFETSDGYGKIYVRK